jgi:hypothetical protein
MGQPGKTFPTQGQSRSQARDAVAELACEDGLFGRRDVAGEAAFDRGKRSIGARSIRPAALG